MELDSDTEIKISISSSSQAASSNYLIDKQPGRKKHLAFSDDEQLEIKNSEYNDDEDDDNYSYNITNNIGFKLKPSSKLTDSQHSFRMTNSYDIEHYFKYRMSKHSFKDYASATYYQYSNSNKDTTSFDKAINTTHSFISEKAINESVNSKKYVSTSTSTEDIHFSIDLFSKQQLLSPSSLYKHNKSLVNASINTDSSIESNKMRNSLSSSQNINKNNDSLKVGSNQKKNSNLKVYRQEYTLNLEDSESDESCDSDSLKIIHAKQTKTNSNGAKTKSWVFKFSNCFENEDDYRKFALIKAGPKRSSEWSIFKNSNAISKENN